MTARELAAEVYSCLPPEMRKRVSKKDILIVTRLIFETITEAIMLGDEVRIRNFGKMYAKFIKGGNLVWCNLVGKEVVRKPNIKLKLEPAKRLKRMVGKARSRMRYASKAERKKIVMEKYGYGKEEKDPKVKEAAQKGKCPSCGSELKGSPPVCKNCGSKPFEKTK